VDVLIRQAHPGPDAPPYDSLAEKLRDAERYRHEEGIPWPVLVDDLDGTVHQAYGGLADPSYLIDVDGRVAFYELWTHAPTLHRAIRELLARGGRGVVLGGIDRRPHLLPALTAGWRALERGLPQSYLDLETASPGAATVTWLFGKLRPVLAPLTLRATPLPRSARLALAAGATALAGLAAFGIRRAMKR